MSPLTLSVLSVVLILLLPKKRYRWLLLALGVLLGARYLLWRGLETLNTGSQAGLWLSVVLLVAEVYGFFQIALFFLQASVVTDRSPPAPGDEEDLPRVDIFLPIYNEPAHILYRTVVGCQALDYPSHKMTVYVLDDGRREEIRELARRLGCRYLTREDNRYAKAGNLNNGLARSEGELVAVFDCDHVPVRTFLKETVGFFQDPQVAIVQTPQHFYNLEFFQQNLKIERGINHEQDLFFHIIQPGRDYFNSAFFCGSGGVLRRSALEEIGGFSQYASIEDLPTSLEIHARGYKSVYLNEDLSAGLAPESYNAYLSQRMRWTRAGMQMFLLRNPLFKKGLSIAQRVNYFSTIYYFFHGFARLIILAWPLTFLLFGVSPIMADITSLLHYFIAYQAAIMTGINSVSKTHRNTFFNDVFETIASFHLSAAALSALLHPRRVEASATPKGERFDRASLSPSILPHTLLLVCLLLGVGHGFSRLHSGEYSASLVICLFWGLYNTLLLVVAVISARERRQVRRLIRPLRKIKCELFCAGRRIDGHTKDISEDGCSLVVSQRLAVDDSPVKIRLSGAYGEVTEVTGQVVRYDKEKGGVFVMGVEFTGVDEALRQSLVRQIYSPSESWRDDHLYFKGTGENFTTFISSPLSIFIRERLLKRLSPRFSLTLPCEVSAPSAEGLKGVSKDISSSGLSVELSGDVTLPRDVDIKLEKEERSVEVRGRVVWRIITKGKTRAGIRFSPPFKGNYLWEKLGF